MKETISKNLKPTAEFPGGVVSCEYDFGANLQEAIALYGEEAVFELYTSKAVIVIQSELAKVLTGKDENDEFLYPEGVVPQKILDEYFSNYLLEYKRGRASNPIAKISKALGDISKMTEDQKAAMRAELLAMLGE